MSGRTTEGHAGPTRAVAVNHRAPLLSVVIPVRNEDANIACQIAQITQALGPVAHQIVSVDGGSTDGTLAALRALQRDLPHLVVRCPPGELWPIGRDRHRRPELDPV